MKLARSYWGFTQRATRYRWWWRAQERRAPVI